MTTEVVDVRRIGSRRREQLADELLDVLTDCWDCTRAPQGEASARQHLREYLADALDPRAQDVFDQVVLFRRDGRVVGYNHAMVASREVDGRRVETIRLSSQVRAEARHENLVTRGFLRLLARYARRHAFSPHPRYYCGLLFSPISYYFAHRRAQHIHPSPIAHEPDPMMLPVYRAVYGPGAEDRGGVPFFPPTVMDERSRRWIERSDDPTIRYFVDKNPRYEEGYGLPVVIRMRPRDLLYSLYASARRAATSKLRRRGRRARRGPSLATAR